MGRLKPRLSRECECETYAQVWVVYGGGVVSLAKTSHKLSEVLHHLNSRLDLRNPRNNNSQHFE